MTPSPISLDQLDESIQNLKELLSIDESRRTTAQTADVFLASAQLMVALKADTAALQNISR